MIVDLLRDARDGFLNTVPGPWRGLRPRRFQAYGLGAPRSGSTFLAHVFQGSHRAEREPDYVRSLEMLRAVRDGRLSERELGELLSKRDRRLHLELEASCFLSELAPALHRTFPDARFVLLLRDCYSWLDSILNLGVGVAMSQWDRGGWFSTLFRPERFQFSEHDAPLKRRGLYPLSAYLEHWSTMNRAVLDGVPDSHLLVVKTPELSTSIPDIALHLGIQPGDLDAKTAHRNRMRYKHGVTAELDPHYLRDSCAARCGPLMSEFFPDVTFERWQHQASARSELGLQKLVIDIEKGNPAPTDPERVKDWFKRTGAAARREWERRRGG